MLSKYLSAVQNNTRNSAVSGRLESTVMFKNPNKSEMPEWHSMLPKGINNCLLIDTTYVKRYG